MSYLDDFDYHADTTFLQEWLAEIIPTDITHYSLFLLYRNADTSLDKVEKPKHHCMNWEKGHLLFYA